MTTRILAFDPGDVWLGVAALLHTQNVMRAEVRVLHIPSRSFRDAIDEALHMGDGVHFDVVCEDYRVRPVGHQRWSSGETLKCIGALRYVTEENLNASWQVVPPGSPTEVDELTNGLFTRWREDWGSPASSEWKHALSAWRVLLRHLMKTDGSLLMRLRSPRTHATYRTVPHWYPTVVRKREDLLAPCAHWIV